MSVLAIKKDRRRIFASLLADAPRSDSAHRNDNFSKPRKQAQATQINVACACACFLGLEKPTFRRDKKISRNTASSVFSFWFWPMRTLTLLPMLLNLTDQNMPHFFYLWCKSNPGVNMESLTILESSNIPALLRG